MLLQNIDATAMATALPSIARSLSVPALELNLIITTYLVSVAVFLPLSAWLADRHGPKTMFCVAVSLFTVASALCAMAGSALSLILFRFLQGAGAAMMVPVGRLILLRSVPASRMVTALIWYAVPPVIGRLAGPVVGGAIVSVASWHWIFLVNIPAGILVVALAQVLVGNTPADARLPPLDLRGLLYLAVGLGCSHGALETLGRSSVPMWLSAGAAVLGISALWYYGRHGARHPSPAIDLGLLKLPTFRANILGAVPMRVGLTAMPFLLPLMFQLGFGLSPLAAGVLMAGSALGALSTRAIARLAIRHFGFRGVLLCATTLSAVCFAAYALFRPATGHALVFLALFAGGLMSSLCMISLNTLAFVDVPQARMSHGTAMTTMAQQLSSGLGVVIASAVVSAVAWRHREATTELQWYDFSWTFCIVGLITLLSLPAFSRLDRDVGNVWR
ncbi:MAG: MFS transporter [Gammaproteobacteria bacterium]|nr:MFS transporter [Gammaproteobacteria bacterium]